MEKRKLLTFKLLRAKFSYIAEKYAVSSRRIGKEGLHILKTQGPLSAKDYFLQDFIKMNREDLEDSQTGRPLFDRP